MAKRKKKAEVSYTKTRLTADYVIFEETLKKFEMTPSDLCEALGYSRGAYNAWRREHIMPKVVSLACEGLKRRNGLKQEIIIRAKDAEVIIGDGKCTEVHPGLFVLEL